MSTLTVASSAEDANAVEAIENHHAAMLGALGLAVEKLALAGPADQAKARDAVVELASTEVLPHAAAEEATLYAAAREIERLRLLVDAMTAEHQVLADLVHRVESGAGQSAISAAEALWVLLELHVAKENDYVLPALASEPTVSLAELLSRMHDLFESDPARVAVPKESGCGGHCACGEQDAGVPELDVRTIPHAIRHATVFGALSAVQPGGAMILVAHHDPVPLLGQVADIYPGAFEISYETNGPEEWRLRFDRRG